MDQNSEYDKDCSQLTDMQTSILMKSVVSTYVKSSARKMIPSAGVRMKSGNWHLSLQIRGASEFVGTMNQVNASNSEDLGTSKHRPEEICIKLTS